MISPENQFTIQRGHSWVNWASARFGGKALGRPALAVLRAGHAFAALGSAVLHLTWQVEPADQTNQQKSNPCNAVGNLNNSLTPCGSTIIVVKLRAAPSRDSDRQWGRKDNRNQDEGNRSRSRRFGSRCTSLGIDSRTGFANVELREPSGWTGNCGGLSIKSNMTKRSPSLTHTPEKLALRTCPRGHGWKGMQFPLRHRRIP